MNGKSVFLFIVIFGVIIYFNWDKMGINVQTTDRVINGVTVESKQTEPVAQTVYNVSVDDRYVQQSAMVSNPGEEGTLSRCSDWHYKEEDFGTHTGRKMGIFPQSAKL